MNKEKWGSICVGDKTIEIEKIERVFITTPDGLYILHLENIIRLIDKDFDDSKSKYERDSFF